MAWISLDFSSIASDQDQALSGGQALTMCNGARLGAGVASPQVLPSIATMSVRLTQTFHQREKQA